MNNNDVWIDEYGVTYSADKKRLIKGNQSLTEYRIIEGCEIIGFWAFHFFHIQSNLSKIYIPKSVTIIEFGAFANCKKIKEIYLPKGLKTIEGGAFISTNLESFYIPNNVSKFEYSFYGCQKLQEIICNNPYFQSIDGVLFSRDLKTLLAYPPAKKDSEYYIPNGVTMIGKCAFSSCRNLRTIHIPASVKTISSSAFYECELQNVILPNRVTTIWFDTFQSCRNLTSITIPDSVTSIKSRAFANCTGLTNITIPDSVTCIGKAAFAGCSKLKEIHCINPIPPKIGEDCFEGIYKVKCRLFVPVGSKKAYQATWGF